MEREWNMREISSIIEKDMYRFLEPMSQHTVLKAGGTMEFYIEISSENHLVNIIAYFKSRDIPYVIMGNGSKKMFRDSQIDGVVLSLGQAYGNIRIKKEKPGRHIFDKSGTYIVTAQAGASLSAIAKKALDSSLSGFEFAAGIPGTVGGAIAMDTGVYESQVKDVLVDARILEENGSISVCDRDALEMLFRQSDRGREHEIVLSARFRLIRK